MKPVFIHKLVIPIPRTFDPMDFHDISNSVLEEIRLFFLNKLILININI